MNYRVFLDTTSEQFLGSFQKEPNLRPSLHDIITIGASKILYVVTRIIPNTKSITPFDLSTAVFSGNDLDISSEDGAVSGITISTDGLRLFMLGSVNLKIFQYNLSTKNDLSTAVFSGNDLDISAESIDVSGITISTDGLTMFTADIDSDKIFQYNLSTKNDLSTAVFSGNDLDVSLQLNQPLGLTISADGRRIITGGAFDVILQYDLSPANNLTDGKFSGNDLDVSLQDAFHVDMTLSSDSRKLFVAGFVSKKIYQYDLPLIVINTSFDYFVKPQDSSNDSVSLRGSQNNVQRQLNRGY